MSPPIDHVAFGPVTIRIYGIIIATSVLIAYYFARKRAAVYQLPFHCIDDALPWLLIAGIVGARLYHVIDYSNYYWHHFFAIFAIWQGGIGIFGGLAGGFFALWLFCRQAHLSIKTLLDTVCVPLLFAQGVGRWGNFFNQEAFGHPTKLPIYVTIDVFHRPLPWLGYAHYQPLFLYEFMWDCGGAVVLYCLSRRLKPFPGSLFGLYCLIFGIGRMLVEPFRFDTAHFGLFDTAILFCLCLIAVGAALFWQAILARQPQENTLQ